MVAGFATIPLQTKAHAFVIRLSNRGAQAILFFNSPSQRVSSTGASRESQRMTDRSELTQEKMKVVVIALLFALLSTWVCFHFTFEYMPVEKIMQGQGDAPFQHRMLSPLAMLGMSKLLGYEGYSVLSEKLFYPVLFTYREPFSLPSV